MMKILVSPTQSEKFERCAHVEHMPIRLYVRKDHQGNGGYEVASTIKNPLYVPPPLDPETPDLEGEGIKKDIKRFKKTVKAAGVVAGAASPAVGLVAPQIGIGLGMAAAATRAVLGDGEAVVPVDERRKQDGKLPRYVIAKKNTN
jgi:hypothetical protein